ncbi:Fe-S cluster assembly protein SufD [Janibacter melonis]|uniref:Fe-S cluster assembly protein SufD n=1 Tax=Janibacter melonis TaxID=262209 RepID=UPI0019186294
MSLLTQNPSTPNPRAHSHGGPVVPDQSRAERTRSFDPADFAVPTGREEDWRFTPVADLHSLLGGESTGGALSREESLPEGVTTSVITSEQARELGAPEPADRAAVLASSASDGVLHLQVPADADVSAPVHLRLSGDGGTAYGHVLVTVGRFARATVVVEHTGDARYSELLSVVTGDGSDLTLVSTQEWADSAQHLAQHDVVVGRDARVRHIAVTLGGGVVRLSTNATYAGPGASFEGLGVYFADSGQHLEHRLFVDHEAPHCTSNVEYKGALQGETARTVWVGDVLIRAAAEGTDTYELNRNLLLTDGARADSVPNLEIETGEIAGAGHASTTGRLDAQHLFYLQSRGIPVEEARQLVVRGFFASTIGRIGVPEVTERIMGAIEAELAGADLSSLAPADAS